MWTRTLSSLDMSAWQLPSYWKVAADPVHSRHGPANNFLNQYYTKQRGLNINIVIKQKIEIAGLWQD
jgi:SH3-like domain-containing protein